MTIASCAPAARFVSLFFQGPEAAVQAAEAAEHCIEHAAAQLHSSKSDGTEDGAWTDSIVACKLAFTTKVAVACIWL